MSGQSLGDLILQVWVLFIYATGGALLGGGVGALMVLGLLALKEQQRKRVRR